MGVAELVPFLLRAYPNVVRTLPDRLQQLRGKTVVIDATLITLRFHFSPVPHASRHVLGWYHLIKELRQSGVQPICVFDGTQRSVAKKAEAERRKSSLKLIRSRATVEEERLRRIRRLDEAMQVLQKARGPRRREVAAALAESVSGTPANIAFPIQPSPSPPLLENQVEDDWKDSELYQLFRETPGTSTEETVRRLSDMDPWEHVINPTLDPTRAEVNGRYADSPVPSMPQNMLPTIAQRELPALLKDLYSSFYQSVQKLNPEAKGSEGTTEHTISKRQIALAAEEKEVWNDLLNALSSSRPIKSIGSRLISMGEQSALISKSFQRRLDVPTAQTHAESKDILRAMGVPYLETDGPFEAEGLASSIVRRGHADYVISEDTDVLVYQAPLLRNITYRKGPLSLIHGAEVRDALGLTDAGWIDYALLLGTDFTQRIPLVGPARALAFMRKHGRIEDILAEEKAYPPRGTVEDYLDRVHQARHVFNTLPPIPPLHMLRNRSQNDGEVEAIMATYHLHTDMWESGTENDIAMGENYFKDSPAGFAPYL